MLRPLISADPLTALKSLAGRWLCPCMHGEEAGRGMLGSFWQLLAVTCLLVPWQGPEVTCQAGQHEATACHAMPSAGSGYCMPEGSGEGVHACKLRSLPLSHCHWRLVGWSQLFLHGLLPLAVPHTVFRPPPCSGDHHTKRNKRYQPATWAFAFSAFCLCPKNLSICSFA